MPEFEGLTRDVCASGCNVTRCVISGKPYCAHPGMSGLQIGDVNNPEIAARYSRARTLLGLDVPRPAKPPVQENAA